MTSRTEQLVTAIRQSAAFQALIPMEAGTGWLMPSRKNNTLYVIVPFYGNRYSQEQKQTLLFPLLATITVEWATGKIVEYVDLQFRCPWEPGDWSQPVGTFPHIAVQNMTHDTYIQARHSLMNHYDVLFQHLSEGRAIPEESSKEFARLLRLLMEPSLEPYYRALAPRFFDKFLNESDAISVG